jgi:molecular chaperone DnaK
MRNKIDYGIDLGTTNSAIARMENGVPTIKKSDTLKDTFPSCIHFNRKKDIMVGDSAYSIMKIDNARALKNFEAGKSNTFIEFKRTMGTTHTYESTNMGRSYTSEELSSEILKTLKTVIKDENINSIVITVPAKFITPQNEATKEAAKLLGFKQIELLQEPVAAATAYGLGSKSKDGFWLVFDFGGGTFDAALIKAEEGILSVKDTDGDSWLGGKNLDEAIVDQIILPNLQQNFAINSILEDTSKKEILRNAVKFYAEDAKIQLSFKDTFNILSNLGDLPFEDENGEEPIIEVLVTQKDMDNALSPIFQKAIDICKDLLKRNNLNGSDLGALILVGGPTYSPVLRKMLKEQITDNVDTSVDPMTVVAKGAALFASTISVSDEVKDATRDSAKLQLEINYEATTVEIDTMINLKVLKDKTIGGLPDKIYAEIVRFDGSWSSGKKAIGEKASLFDIQLAEGRSNSFDINVYDNEGNILECEPKQFSILQGIGGLDGMQVLPYNIGIAKFFHFENKDLFQPVKGLEINKRIPATGVVNGLKTRSEIRPGMSSDFIRIPIYQGDYDAEGSNPVLNNFVTEVIISGMKLPGLLPEGSDVDITIKVDRSQLMKFSAYFPILNYTEELEIEIKQTEAPTEELLITEISKAKKAAIKIDANEVIESLDKLESQLDNEKGNADGKMKIMDGLRKELIKLEVAEKNAEWPKVEEELKSTFYDFEDLVDKIKSNNIEVGFNIEKLETTIADFKKSVENIIHLKDLKAAKELNDLIFNVSIELRNDVTGGDIDRRRVEYLDSEFDNLSWKDKNKARQLINQGLMFVAEGKSSQLDPLVRQIYKLKIDLTEGDDGGTLE